MPVGAWAHRGRVLQRWLAVLVVAVLSSAPFALPSLPVELASVPAAAHEAAHGKQPATGLCLDDPATLGIVSRPPSVGTTLALPRVKPAVVRPAGEPPVLAWQGTTAQGGELRGILQRSSVGTARTPTGPPS